MSPEHFEWDINKAKANEKKHKVSFDEATSVFHDQFAIYLDDEAHSMDEERFLILGQSIRDNTLTVCYCMRQSDTIVRIISARKATKQERDMYFNQ